MPILMVLIFLIALFFFLNKKNKGYISTTSYMVLIYIISIGCGFMLYLFKLRIPAYPIAIDSMLYFILAFSLSIWPFLHYKERDILYISISNQKLFYYLKIILIIVSLFSIVFYFPHVTNALTGNIRDNRITVAQGGAGFGVFGLLNTFAATSALLYAVLLLMFFLSIIIKQKISFEAILLLISSFSYVVLILAFVGRDGMVYWAMSFIFYYIFFKRFMTSVVRKKLKRIGYISSLIFIIPFGVITAARFGSHSNVFAVSILDYVGQSIINFNDNFQIEFSHTSGGHRSFPLFARWFDPINSSQVQKEIEHTEAVVLKGGINYWSFGTYIKSFLYDFGKVGTIVLIIFISIIEWKALHKASTRKVFDISNLIVYVLIFQIIGQGVFYFRFYTPGYNFYMLLMLALGITLKFRNGKTLYIPPINAPNSFMTKDERDK